MSERRVFVVSENFYQLHSCSEFLKNTCGGVGDWKLAKENVHADIFNGFEHTGNV